MYLHCPECNSQVEVKMDMQTKEVVCEHGHVITKEITHFTKETLKSMKDYWDKPKIKQAYSFYCKECRGYHSVDLTEDNSSTTCSNCGAEIKLTDIMFKVVQEKLMAEKKNGQ